AAWRGEISFPGRDRHNGGLNPASNVCVVRLSCQNLLYRPNKTVELSPLRSELFASVRGQRVIPGAAVVLGRSPLGRDVSVEQQSLQSRVERTLAHLEHVRGNQLQMLGDAVTVHPSTRQRSQNQQIERTWEQF